LRGMHRAVFKYGEGVVAVSNAAIPLKIKF
jgi:hypothetical protein